MISSEEKLGIIGQAQTSFRLRKLVQCHKLIVKVFLPIDGFQINGNRLSYGSEIKENCNKCRTCYFWCFAMK